MSEEIASSSNRSACQNIMSLVVMAAAVAVVVREGT